MARATHHTISTESQRDRLARGTGSLKLLRFRVPDPADVRFRAEAARQAELLRGAPEEADAQNFIEAATEWPDA